MALSADAPRTYHEGDFIEWPAVASDIIYQGAAVGHDGSGNARPLVAADAFLGFAVDKIDNSAGAAGDKTVRVRATGKIALAVGSLVDANLGDEVYASDDGTFTLSSVGNSFIGRCVRVVSAGNGIIQYAANVKA